MIRNLCALACLLLPGVARGEGETDGTPGRDHAALAAAIDRLVDADLARAGVAPNPPSDDATFVRRAYLQIVGRIPTAEEARSFLGDRSAEKRSRLIDRLLLSPGHESHLFTWYADLLRAKSRLAPQISGEPYLHWIKEAIAANEPYDRIARELLTASGPAHGRGNGETGYYLRDRGMPEDNMANTARVFLGTRLECAQCHNHPFDKWTQRDFFEMAAFTGGLEYTDQGLLQSEQGRALREQMAALRREGNQQAQQMINRFLRPVLQGVSGSGTGYAQLPKDYKYDDARGNQWIRAAVPFGEMPELAYPQKELTARARMRPRRQNEDGRRRDPHPAIDSREAYAEWITSPQNPRFAPVLANRLWKRAFGLGLVEPVDDWKDDTKPVNPELMAHLTALVVQLGFDLREMERVLYRTQAWQREATRSEPRDGEAYHFQGPLLRRLSAEQLWDSLLTLIVPDLDATLAPPGARAEEVYARYESVVSAQGDELAQQMEEYEQRLKDPAAFRAKMREEAATRARAEAEKRRAARAEAAPLLAELNRARRAGDAKRVAEIEAELRQRGLLGEGLQRRADLARDLRRASDLPSPAPGGHLLREFGQSDRETIEAAFDAPSVPQVLSLLNGFLEEKILAEKRGVLMSALEAAKVPDEKIRTAYLAILARQPTAPELALWRAEVARDGVQGEQDLVWTLLNTHEFRFAR